MRTTFGAARERLEAKVFGGGKVLNVNAESLNVGSRNAAFVLDYLSAEGIPVDGQCLGGEHGLLVRFYPHTGQAQAKPLPIRRGEVQFDNVTFRYSDGRPAIENISFTAQASAFAAFLGLVTGAVSRCGNLLY